MVNRKRFWFLGSIFALVLLVTGYFEFINKGQPVYFKLVSGYGDFNRDVVNWLKLKEVSNGIYAYSLDNSNPYELIVFYNKENGKFLYNTLGLKASLFNRTLKINITDKLANNDAEVKNRLIADFVIKQKPTNIEVYLNNKPIKLLVEKREDK